MSLARWPEFFVEPREQVGLTGMPESGQCLFRRHGVASLSISETRQNWKAIPIAEQARSPRRENSPRMRNPEVAFKNEFRDEPVSEVRSWLR